MAKFSITYTVIYNGYGEVEAETYDEAMKEAEKLLDNGGSSLPSSGHIGDINFFFGEVTADYADELKD